MIKPQTVPTPPYPNVVRHRSFWQKWFPTPKKNQERADALEAELILLEQRFEQLESQAAAGAAASEQRFEQLESQAAAGAAASEQRFEQLESQAAAGAAASEQRFEQLESQAAAGAAASEQRFEQLESQAAAGAAASEQRFEQLESQAAAGAAASEQRFEQLESQAAALSLANRSLLAELEKHLRTLTEASSFPKKEKATSQALKAIKSAQSLEFDAFYATFEAKFRGSREAIMERQSHYLPLVTEKRTEVAKQMPSLLPPLEGPHAPLLEALRAGQGVLDLGSGRGEWLELLRKNDIPAMGIELNQIFLKDCAVLGLNVIASDVIDYLTQAPTESVAVVTGFHIIEHLPFPILQEFIRQTQRILCPGGIAIFETPNPRNILVSALNFWIDPTHLHPVHPDFIKFLLEDSGFTQVRLDHLTPYPPEFHVGSPDDPLAQRFNELFYGPQDLAVIGTKPSA